MSLFTLLLMSPLMMCTLALSTATRMKNAQLVTRSSSALRSGCAAVMQGDEPPLVGGEDEAAKRAESGKAAAVSLIAGTAGGLPFLLLGKAAEIPPGFTAAAWELQADGLAVMLLLFGIVYRYAVRTDKNQMLKQGVVGAFVITRSWALITPSEGCSALPLNCGPPLGYFSWGMIAQGAFATVETGVACAAAAVALEVCFDKGWIQRSTTE
eukprot:CAMPEP_0119095330 /NCGR_PEP_ID=MMETSP1178-20130426/169130_1 /TAXON_ID=33656 /ORGANISM="unid sp, Strain CCMP2000" /LENGTH=210 /DNA_ID=CAMNT_0007079125 /DNA_START=26 /DNA_END=658 /DNA_ORIENTATION=+